MDRPWRIVAENRVHLGCTYMQSANLELPGIVCDGIHFLMDRVVVCCRSVVYVINYLYVLDFFRG